MLILNKIKNKENQRMYPLYIGNCLLYKSQKDGGYFIMLEPVLLDGLIFTFESYKIK